MSVYFAVYPTLVLAFRVAEVDCKLQLVARPSGRQPAVDLGVKIAPDFYFTWEWSLKKKHECLLAVAVQLQLSTRNCNVAFSQLQRRVLATATSRSRNCNVAFSSCMSWHRLLASVFSDDTGVNRRQTMILTAFCCSCELLTATLYKTNEIYLPSAT